MSRKPKRAPRASPKKLSLAERFALSAKKRFATAAKTAKHAKTAKVAKPAKPAKSAKTRPAKASTKKPSFAERFAQSAERRQLVERLAYAELERDAALARLHEAQERLAIREEAPLSGAVESTSERAERVALRNNEWLEKGGLVHDAYLLPVDTVFGPLALPFWHEAGIALKDSKARELAELFKLERRDIYTIYFSP